MHNKFIVIDNRDTVSAANDWVWTGSWNLTDPGTNSDLQNSIEIQDKALANAFTLEFNEMWGSSTDTPSAAASRFGARKLDNTPHNFVINAVPVQLYFSPSGRTTNQIIRTVGYAQHTIDVCLLTFTRNDIANALLARKNAGVAVRGVMDNNTDQGSQFDSLLAKGIDLRLDINSGQLHHKYAVINAESSVLPQYVITGSHNWSSSAENSNNENTLIIQNNRIVNLYLQEFKARYVESGGAATIAVNVERVGTVIPQQFGLDQNYPNPFNPTTVISYHLPAQTGQAGQAGLSSVSKVSLKVFDLLGREVVTLVDREQSAGNYKITWNATGVPSGIYFYRLQAGQSVQTKKMVLVK
jgi:phosphatidylserine/phosphatidylglycerophosphate/cardiolipin synthase-like enzyme